MFPTRRKHLSRLSTALPLVLLVGCGSAATMQSAAEARHPTHAAAAAPDELQGQLAELYRVTTQFLDFNRAEAAGFTRITPCDADPQLGAQGYHYALPDRVNATVSLLEPEILMYEPRSDGSLRLVGVEYIIPYTARARSAEPPVLLGQRFHQIDRYEVWALHVWLYQYNPSGLFANWNPLVTCQHARG